MRDGWHLHMLRSRHCEADEHGFVREACFLDWFESARTCLMRTAGFPYRFLEERGLRSPLVEVELTLHAPVQLDEQFAVYTRITRVGLLRVCFSSELRTSTHLQQQQRAACSSQVPDVERGSLLAAATTHCTYVDSSWSAVRVDRAAPDLHRLLNDLCTTAQP